MGSNHHTSKLKTLGTLNIPPPKMSLLSLTLIVLMPAIIVGLPQNSDSSCSSQICKDCLDSCDGCDQCKLCALCYCNNGVAGCKKTCKLGKNKPACKKCVSICT